MTHSWENLVADKQKGRQNDRQIDRPTVESDSIGRCLTNVKTYTDRNKNMLFT